MPDWDAIIIGGGPAGLTAGIYLSRGNWRTLLLEKEGYGGYIMNIEMIENYPGFSEGVIGSQLGMEMMGQARKYGVEMKRTTVNSVQVSSGNKWVTCADGTTHTSSSIIFAGGSVPKKLGVPGEEEFRDRGVIGCAFCDGGQFAEQVVAVCGGGDSGITEALYLSKIASKVIVIEAMPKLNATAILQDRVAQNPKLEVHTGMKVQAITGGSTVEGIEVISEETGQKETMKVDGVLVHVGIDPNTDYLQDIVPLDEGGQIIVNGWMETEISGVFAAGDIRSNSPRQVSAAVGDGAAAGMSAQRYLQTLE
ncbi:MAG: FAD-dependent oxidoreductase [Dehalococcoidales bacterium]|nr:FAD-dependent oxidoreductase [Dehalococcoidales bacterium]